MQLKYKSEIGNDNALLNHVQYIYHFQANILRHNSTLQISDYRHFDDYLPTRIDTIMQRIVDETYRQTRSKTPA